MKLKKITIACAAALLSGQAFAHAPGTVADETIWISGASAQDKALAALVTNLCIPGTLDTFKDGGVGKAYTSYFCTIDSSLVTNMSADKKVLINKRSTGGSGKGVQVVADSVAIEAMNINNGNCTDVDADRVWDCDISGGTGDGDLIMQISDAGISDVEPAMFTGPNVPPGDLPVTPAQVAKLDITSMNAVVFGVPVTEALYRALQVAQGKGATDSEADMPTLSSAQVNALITGGVTNWDQFKVNGVSLTVVPGVTPPAADEFPPGVDRGPLVHICRRVPGSGTQAQMNAVFANTPCAAGVKEPLRAPGNPATGPVVQENPGSGDVTTCLQDKQAANKWAIGVQSLEKLDPSFRFVKIDGYSPTLKNVAENKYRDWVETTMQWRNATTTGYPTGDVLAILQKISTDASTPTTIAALNASFVHGFGTGSYLALNTNGHTPDIPHNDANPVTTATHAPLGTPNTCNLPGVNLNSTL